MPAGRSIPDASKQALLRAQVKAGSILLLPCDFIEDPHPKFIVVAHIDYDENFTMLFLVNSHIHPLIEKQPNLKVCQVTLRQAAYPFFDYDSYLNCTKLFEVLSAHELINLLMQEEDGHKAHLNNDDILEVIQAVSCAPTLSEEQKDLIIASLDH